MKYSQIQETPDFSHMPNLEVLNLCWSEMLVHVHPSLGEHVKIKRIYLAYCGKLEEFPRITRMKSLEILDLSDTNLQRFVEIYGNLESLRKLQLRGTPVNGLPASIVGNATCLQRLKLECHRPYKEEFTGLEVVAESFPGLVGLEITGSGILRTLDFSRLPYLERLDLSGSEELVEVDASLGVHKRIKSIDLSNCSKLEEFPGIGDMESLEEVNLSCTNLKSFPEMTGNVNHLVKLNLDATEITTLPWSMRRATSLEVISMQGCEYLLTLPICLLGLQFLRIYLLSGSLKYFVENIDHEASDQREVEIHSHRRKRGKQMIASQGMGRLCGVHVYFRYCESLEELPQPVLSRIEVLLITDCPALTSWICFNLVDLLDKHQHLSTLQLHQEYDIAPHEFLQAFSQWELVSNMLRKRKEFFQVHIPGKRIPSWFRYEISRRSVTVLLPSISDKLRGFVIGGINADLTNRYVPSTSDHFDHNGACCCRPQLHVVVMYIPIETIRRDRTDLDGRKECTLFELSSLPYSDIEMEEAVPRWGLSLVYNQGEADDVDPHQVIIETNDCPESSPYRYATLTVKIARSREHDIVPCELLQGCSEWESMSTMLRKRESFFKVDIPGSRIPPWFQYRISRRSVTVFLPPLSEWYTDKLRGFVVSGINAYLTNGSVPLASDLSNQCGSCGGFHICYPPQIQVVAMYIPIDTIRGDRRDWDGRKECTLFELTSVPYCLGMEMEETIGRWGLRLLYSQGEGEGKGNEVDHRQVIIVTEDRPYLGQIATFRVKIAQSRDMVEVAEL